MESERPQPTDGFVFSYQVDLLFNEPVSIDPDTLPSFDRDDNRLEEGPATEESDWKLILDIESQLLQPDSLDLPLRQSWSWSEARRVAPSLTQSISLRDVRPSSVDPETRVRAINRTVDRLCELLPVIALHWNPTEQLVDPGGFRHAFEIEGESTAYGAINVRMFRIDRYEDETPLEHPETIMDTLGLSAIGLDDFQLHFRSLDPSLVGDYLYRIALHSWNGQIDPRPGSTMEGFDGKAWKLELEEAILPPERGVFDIHTGEEGLAGR